MGKGKEKRCNRENDIPDCLCVSVLLSVSCEGGNHLQQNSGAVTLKGEEEEGKQRNHENNVPKCLSFRPPACVLG